MRTLFKLESGRSASGSDGVDAILLESERYILTEAGGRISLDAASAGYVASAVHVEAGVYGSIPVIGWPNTGKFLYSQWLANTENGTESTNSDVIFICSFPNNLVLYGSLLWLSEGPQQFLIEFFDLNRDPDNRIARYTTSTVLPVSAWTHFAINCDVEHADPDKIVQIAVNGSVVSSFNPLDGMENNDAASLSVAFDIETSMLFFTNGYSNFATFDAAEVQFWSGVTADLANLTNMSKLIAGGKPVDPAVAAVAFGNQTVLLSGNAAGFPVNQGTGGSFTLTGSLTDASTSPSD